ncbi:SDR family oxidoreductase [Bacteroides bouchesdurhonensis]|uniref:SDR family oxidoreductase n=1 Tax=Bacteroides bouchesdurhonensis TaxID=1841855 RepID=UPI0011DC8F21|nr:SDR family oxidoreductase [Bacteroides bouchesdurhonensis]
MKNILIIGANGFTGRQILNDLSKQTRYKITGCSLHPDICANNKGNYESSRNYHFKVIDIRNKEIVGNLFKEVSPDLVINCSALSVPDYCEIHHEEAFLMNVTAVAQLAQLCRNHKCRFIHLSTDFVFDGETYETPKHFKTKKDTNPYENQAESLSPQYLYTEDDTPAPVNYYGYTKWKGEERVSEICQDYAIVRVEIVYGKTLPGQHGNIVQLVMNRLKAGQEIRVVSDQWRTPTYVGDVSVGIQKLMESTHNGIFHICGDEYLAISDIAFQVAEAMNLNNNLIHPVTTKEMNESTPRPRYSGMSIEKAQKLLNYQPRKLKQILREW